MTKPVIYCVTNTVNGKRYIGKTAKGLETRRQTHQFSANRGSNTVFHKAMRKYGYTSFEWSVLHEATDDEDIDELEKLYIERMGTHYSDGDGLGYNMTKGGDGGLMPEESRLRGSQNRQYMWTAERRKSWGEARKGKKLTDDHRAKIKEGLKNSKNREITEETRKRISEARKGFRLTEESKKKISESVKLIMTPERRKQIGDQHRGKIISDEQKAKLSKAHKGRPMDEKTKQALADYWSKNPDKYKARRRIGGK